MKCPHCNHALTDDELKRLWAQRNSAKQTPHAGPGRPRKCVCGTCKTCRKRESVGRYRAKRAGKPTSTLADT